MKVVILENPEAVAGYGTEMFKRQLADKPNSVLGLATGSTPLALYRQLIQANKNGEMSFKEVSTFNLDEYLGLAGDHPQSYRHFMNENLFQHIDIDINNTFVPDGAAENPLTAGDDYEELIKAKGGIDIQLLGIGRNGHVGFNEPSSCLASPGSCSSGWASPAWASSPARAQRGTTRSSPASIAGVVGSGPPRRAGQSSSVAPWQLRPSRRRAAEPSPPG